MSLSQELPTKSFKPIPLRSDQVMEEKSCHDLASTTLHGLTRR